MSLTLYDASVPVFTRGLTILSTLLDKAEAHASETGAAPESYIEARLAPDMLTLAGQVQQLVLPRRTAHQHAVNE